MKFKANDARTRELGSKGGKALHPNGTKTDQIYRYQKFTIKWLKTKHCWSAKSDDGNTKLYARSVAEIKREIANHNTQLPGDFIEAKPEV